LVSFSKAKASYCFYCNLQTTDSFSEFNVNKESNLNRLHGSFILFAMNWLYDVSYNNQSRRPNTFIKLLSK